MKYIAIFFIVFIFIQICAIYVMGGFYEQTLSSKIISVVFGGIVSILIVGIYSDFIKKEQ